ncbi:MAG TPA: hypothetical protein VGQ53_11660 [Chitinophagaceae bacterium]|jgi:hypothetical protein|nr:hypothetical protein [Chitinophagaceae bacterium]
MRFLILAFLTILFWTRGSSQETHEKRPLADSGNQVNIFPRQANNGNYPIDNSNKIRGIWTDGSSENATFEIRKDSIYYVDELSSYKYSLVGNSIKIKYPDWTFTGQISFVKDTLIINSKYGKVRYWKFKG